MTSLQTVVRVLVMCFFCHYLLVVGLWIGCVVMPLRYFGVLKKPEDEEPKVKVFVHEPNKDWNGGSSATPRDTVLLVHGFPDNQHVWDKTVTALAEKGYRCLVAALPGSNGEHVPRVLTFEETATLIKESVEAVTDQAMTVIGHDWGSAYSMAFQRKYPALCKRMILLDVGRMKFGADIHWSAWYAIFSYQTVLALCYWLGHPFGTWIMRLLARVLFRPLGMPRAVNEIRSDMGYHYASLLKLMAEQKDRPTAEESSHASVAHLFVYGSKKLFHFHDSDWLNFVRSTPCGEVAPLPCQHWLMSDEPEALHKIMLDWLDKSSGSMCQG